MQLLLFLYSCNWWRQSPSSLSFPELAFMRPLSPHSFLSTTALSVVFFLSRNQHAEAAFQRRIQYVFIVHSVLLLGLFLREQALSCKNVKGGMQTSLGRYVMVIGAFFNFLWACIGTLALFRCREISRRLFRK